MNFLEILSPVKEVGVPIVLALVLIWLGFQLQRIGSALNDLHQEIGAVRNDLREEIRGIRSDLHEEIGGIREEVSEANKTLTRLLGVVETLAAR